MYINPSDVKIPQDKPVNNVTNQPKTDTTAEDTKTGQGDPNPQPPTYSGGSYASTEKVDNPNALKFEPTKNSIHNFQCILDAITEATGVTEVINKKTGKPLESGRPLDESLLKDATGKKWDAIDINAYTKKGNFDGMTKFLTDVDSEGKPLTNEDGSLKAKTDTIISDGAHTYVLKGFQTEATNDGHPKVTGLIVKDPANGQTRIISPEEIKQGKNFTAFVQERDTDKNGMVGDGSKTGKADGRMAHTYDSLKNAPVNPIDGVKGSESYNIRMFFAALGDPRQKAGVLNVMKEINSANLTYNADGSPDEASAKKLEDLRKTVKDNFGLDIPADELAGIVKIFQSDISGVGGDTTELVNKVKDAKAGKGEFGTLASGYFKKAGSDDSTKVTIGDMFLYMQSGITFSEHPLPSGANLNKSVGEFPPGKTLEPPVKGDVIDGTGMKKGAQLLDPVTKQVYVVADLDSSTQPPQALVKKLDGIGRTEHNYYSTGIQYVQLSFENYGTSPESTGDKAKGLLENLNNLFHGAEGC
jgi:hypothetical protein